MLTMRSPDDRAGYQGGPLHTWSRTLLRNADGHARRLEGALRGAEVPRYPGGSQQRDRDIEAGAQRSANELVHDLEESATRLEQVWTLSKQAGWPNAQLRAADTFPTTGSPVRRLREVEVHHVDLGLGYEAIDWPAGVSPVGAAHGAGSCS